jgi:hypothetical protein
MKSMRNSGRKHIACPISIPRVPANKRFPYVPAGTHSLT